jgi:hypothetical protein
MPGVAAIRITGGILAEGFDRLFVYLGSFKEKMAGNEIHRVLFNDSGFAFPHPNSSLR